MTTNSKYRKEVVAIKSYNFFVYFKWLLVFVTIVQSYDNRGRITQNEVGTYNYSNTNKPYQNTSVTVTPDALTHYQINHEQNITYNAFKSPYQIEEVDKDKISFTYNDNNSRSTMFYGGLQADKLLRPLRKYYSADGSMEIKHNIQTGDVEFVTYIGGDGYTAPIVLKSDGTTQNYLYLQRDYQGSIVGISDETGQIIEKRLFDAWGNVLVQDGAGNTLNGLTILDRGYTGHEHLQSVGLIHMNGRLYDAKLHRFLQPDNYVQDPSNTQNYNRYSYVLNNPLKYTDFCGECYEDDDPDDYDPTCDPPIGDTQQDGAYYNNENGDVWKYNGATQTWEGQTPGATNTYNNVVPLYEITITGTGSSSSGWSYGTESFYNSAYSGFIQGGGGGSGNYSFDINNKTFNEYKGGFSNAINRASLITGMVEKVAEYQIISKYKAGGDVLEAMKDFKSLNGLRGVNKVFQKVGYAGLLIDGLQLSSKMINNKAQTSDYLRFGINTTLTVVAFSNPIGILAVGAYGVFDYYYGDKFWEKTGIDNY